MQEYDPERPTDPKEWLALDEWERTNLIADYHNSAGHELPNPQLHAICHEITVTIVKGKGNKSRIVPIGQYVAHYIQLYLDKARKYMLKGRRNDPGYLFISQRGNPFNNTTINKSVMRSVAGKLENKKYLSCYSFRHATATHLLAGNVDITYIAKLLGHSSLKTTQLYLKVDIGDLKKMHSLYHPRERNR